jgi:hypothetical protein
MEQHKDNQPAPAMPEVGNTPEKIASAGEKNATRDTIAKLDAPAAASPGIAAAAAPKLEAEREVEAKAETEAAPTVVMATATAATSALGWTRTQAQRLRPHAAAVATAAAIGALAGSIATAGLGTLRAGEPVTHANDMRPVQEAIARLDRDLTAIKTAIDTSGKSSTTQLVKLSDRLDRVERGQAEPAAKLAKLTDAVDRIERRAPAAQNAANDVTGSIASAAPASTTAAAPARPDGPPVLGGWAVRSVYQGVALIQGRMGGMIEVEPGDHLPGLGRIDAIRRQDGRWVVVTSKGLIIPR